MADDLTEVARSVISSPDLSVTDTGKVIGYSLEDVVNVIPDIREAYEGEFVITVVNGNGSGIIDLHPIDGSHIRDTVKGERLLRAILDTRSEEYETYRMENNRVFLCGNFKSTSRPLTSYGFHLYNIEFTNPIQEREYVPTENTLDALLDWRHRQIIDHLDCPNCGSSRQHISSFSSQRCQECRQSVSLEDFDVSLTQPVKVITETIYEEY